MKGLFFTIFTFTVMVSHGGETKRLNSYSSLVKNQRTQELNKSKTLKNKTSNKETIKQYIPYCIVFAGIVCCSYLFYRPKKKDKLSQGIDKHNKDVYMLKRRLKALKNIPENTLESTFQECLNTIDRLKKQAQELEEERNKLDRPNEKPFIEKCTLTEETILNRLIKEHNQELDQKLSVIRKKKLRTIINSNYTVAMGVYTFKERGKRYNTRANILLFLGNNKSTFDSVKNCTDKLNELLDTLDNDDEKEEKKKYVLYMLHSRLKGDFYELFPGFTTNIDYKNFNPKQYSNVGN